MGKEYSFGAVIYHINQGTIEYLLERMASGHTSLPKGHIEKGETPVETAKREIKEELNLDVDLDTSFAQTITYSPAVGISKDVTFFLAVPTSDRIITQKTEVDSAYWASFEKAIKDITHTSDRAVLTAANEFILKNKVK